MRASQHERDRFATALLQEGSEAGGIAAELVDLASIQPSVRRQLARVLGALEAQGPGVSESD
jgi:hypothetical protein